MAYCEQCGNKLSDTDRFCDACGAAVSQATINEEVVEIQPGDVATKDLDLSRGYYMTIDGRVATMYMDNGQMIRRFTMRANVIQATTTGEMVTILTDDGYTTLFKWTGQMIRRTRSR